MSYLALVWQIAGYSIAATRVGMLLVAAAGLYFTFLLAIRLCGNVPGAPAFPAVLLMIATPLYYTQAMMAQLDMPAMTLTALALVLFLDRRYAWCAAACVVLVMVKETGAVLPAILAAWLAIREKRFREAAYFTVPFIALAVWLLALKRATGHWLGDAGFAHYNVEYALSPVRAICALLRRVWFLFIVDFRWIGTLAMVHALRSTRIFLSGEWLLVGLFLGAHVLLVSLFGGAALERYLLPVFPILCIGMITGCATLPAGMKRLAIGALVCGMFAGYFWNPPYPAPLENNLAMVDFVRLQKAAAVVLERDAPSARVASAWPYTAALRRPDFGFTSKPFPVVETNDFHARNVIEAVSGRRADVLVVYARTWEPPHSILAVDAFESFLRKYYDYEPQIRPEEIESKLGLRRIFRFSRRGQWIEAYERRPTLP